MNVSSIPFRPQAPWYSLCLLLLPASAFLSPSVYSEASIHQREKVLFKSQLPHQSPVSHPVCMQTYFSPLACQGNIQYVVMFHAIYELRQDFFISSGKFIKILLPMKKEIWHGYDRLQFPAKKILQSLVVKCFHDKNSSLRDSTLIFFVEHPQMGKPGEKGKGC